MDKEKLKHNYKWDPSLGDYSKSHISYEKRILEKEQKKRFYLIIGFVLVLILSVVILLVKFN